MAHVDAVLPGRVHRVIYERMVDDTEAEVRALLDYCGLEFEPACLEFYRTERAVRTASSEQVRQPIYRDATEEWRAYEPHFGRTQGRARTGAGFLPPSARVVHATLGQNRSAEPLLLLTSVQASVAMPTHSRMGAFA